MAIPHATLSMLSRGVLHVKSYCLVEVAYYASSEQFRELPRRHKELMNDIRSSSPLYLCDFIVNNCYFSLPGRRHQFDDFESFLLPFSTDNRGDGTDQQCMSAKI
jgi:hypothetical protein